jgi:MOSC domain-containing protein YiiM
MIAKILKLCTSQKKGTIKKPVPKIELKVNHGIINDAHAGNWHRQISLLAQEDIKSFSLECFEKKGINPDLPPGCFAENILTSGIDLCNLSIGDRLITAPGPDAFKSLDNSENNPEICIMEITQIGKECHDGCEIKKITGACVMPKKGLFAKVIKGGTVKEGYLIKPENYHF